MDKEIKIQNGKKYSLLLKKCLVLFFLSFLSVKNALSMSDEEDEPSNFLSSSHIKIVETNAPSRDPEIELTTLGVIREDQDQLNDLTYFFIQKYLVQQEAFSEDQFKKGFRVSAKVMGGLLGGLAGVPFFAVGREAGGENGVIALGMGLSNTIAISGIGSWSYFNLLKGLDPQSPEEKNLIPKRNFQLPAHLLSHTLGLIVAVPTGYMAVRYNTHKWLAIISYGVDYSLKTNGFLTFYNSIASQKGKTTEQSLITNEEEKEYSSLDIQQNLVQHLSKKTIPTLLTMGEHERNEFISALYSDENMTVENYLNSLLSLAPSNPPEDTPDSWKKGYPKKMFVGGISISPFINAIHNGYCAYAGWSSLYDNMYFTVPMAVLTTVPIFGLELKSTITTTSLLYDSAFYRISGHPQRSLEQTLYPKFTRALPFVCLSLAGITTYVGRFMVVDVLEDVLPRDVSLFLAVAGFASPFIFASYANYSLVKDCLLGYTQSFGEGHKSSFVSLIQDIKKLASIIQLTNPQEIENFIKNPKIANILSTANNNDGGPETLETNETNLEEKTTKNTLKNKNKSRCGVM